jgi:hypothetical protein
MTGELFVKIKDIKDNKVWFDTGTFIKDKAYPVLEVEVINGMRKIMIVTENGDYLDVELQRVVHSSYRSMADIFVAALKDAHLISEPEDEPVPEKPKGKGKQAPKTEPETSGTPTEDLGLPPGNPNN